MNESVSSTSARRDGSARDAVEIAAYDITDAIEAVRGYVNEYASLPTGNGVVDLVERDGQVVAEIKLGHLRAILAALSAPYVPGMVEVEYLTFAAATDGRSALLSVFEGPDGRGRTDNHYFAEVSR